MYVRYLEVCGKPYERGVQIGEKLKDGILTNYQNQKFFYQALENFNYEAWGKIAQKYIPLMEKWTPDVLDEVKGMAKGADIEFFKVLALTTAYEKSFGRENVSEKCTSFFVTGEATREGKTIVGQTNDENLREWRYERDVVIHHIDGDEEMLIYTHPGVPAYMGMNNRGLSILWTYIDNGKTGNGIPTNAIIRHVLSLKNIEEAVQFLQDVPHDIPNQFGLADRNGNLVCLECFPNKVYTIREKNTFVHTNHNVYALEEPDCTTGKTTRDRLGTMQQQIKDHWGNIDVELAKKFLSSHEGGTHSICVHPNSERPWNKTLAAMVFDLNEGIMNIAFGNPCEVPYQQYRFEKYN